MRLSPPRLAVCAGTAVRSRPRHRCESPARRASCRAGCWDRWDRHRHRARPSAARLENSAAPACRGGDRVPSRRAPRHRRTCGRWEDHGRGRSPGRVRACRTIRGPPGPARPVAPRRVSSVRGVCPLDEVRQPGARSQPSRRATAGRSIRLSSPTRCRARQRALGSDGGQTAQPRVVSFVCSGPYQRRSARRAEIRPIRAARSSRTTPWHNTRRLAGQAAGRPPGRCRFPTPGCRHRSPRTCPATRSSRSPRLRGGGQSPRASIVPPR